MGFARLYSSSQLARNVFCRKFQISRNEYNIDTLSTQFACSSLTAPGRDLVGASGDQFVFQMRGSQAICPPSRMFRRIWDLHAFIHPPSWPVKCDTHVAVGLLSCCIHCRWNRPDSATYSSPMISWFTSKRVQPLQTNTYPPCWGPACEVRSDQTHVVGFEQFCMRCNPHSDMLFEILLVVCKVKRSLCYKALLLVPSNISSVASFRVCHRVRQPSQSQILSSLP
nr:hypothetical protein CFP56_70593 [Quercus suber]